jgi:hypothetical protein
MSSAERGAVWLRRLPVAASALLLLVGAVQVAAADPETADRLDIVRTIEMIARQSSGGATPTTLDTAGLEAMRRVPRHAFVPAARRSMAYANRPRAKTTPSVSTCRKAGPTATRSSMRSTDAVRA